MTLPSTEVQKAVYARLIAANIPGVGSKVFHRVPASTPLPYLEIGRDLISGNDDAGDFYDCEVEIEVFATTIPEAKAIAERIHAALNSPLVLNGFSCHEHHFVGLRPSRSIQGSDIVETIVVEFEYMIQKIA